MRGIDVVEPGRARLVEVLVGVDHGSHPRPIVIRSFSPNLTPMSPLHGLTLGDVLREHRRSRPDRIAAVDGDVRLTCRARRKREPARERPARRGSVPAIGIVWLGQNSFRVLECLLAAAKLGAYFCPVNWRQSADELAFVLDDLSPAVAVWQEAEIGDTVRGPGSRRPAARALGTTRRRPREYETLLAAGVPDDRDLAVDPNDAASC